ncbi:YihY family inner membrane protein [Vogesella sp. LIG4]|uniref:YihY family inner membrane protein n=1 Tax=Vogesella sp. LIG4 TaxID=1192162 RepID=UPI00081F9C4D|nr:YihY family inner membrane protein [Vogesella sp. LIG4]SCK15304.1 membrane protein [Vogesella sp. LIG4]
MSLSVPTVFGFAVFIRNRLAQQRVLQVAGSLTFTTLLALVPLLTIALTMMSAFPVFSDYSTRFKVMLLSTLVPEFAGKVITVYMRQFADNAEKLTAAGIVMLGVTSLMLMSTVERTFNSIWGVRRARPWLQQGMVYWTVLTLGPLVLGGGLLGWRLLFKTTRIEHTMPLLAETLQALGSIGLTMLVLGLLFRIVPNRYVPMRHAMLGGLVTAVLLEVTKLVFGFYIGEVANYQLVYGAFASLPILLLWLFCLWLVVLVGAVLTASFSYWEGRAWRRRLEPRRRFLDAVEVLVMLDRAQDAGQALRPEDLRREVKVGYDELGSVLDKLALAGYVQKGGNDGWVLLKRAEGISLADVFRLFVYRPELNAEDDDIAAGVEQLLQPTMGELAQFSVAEFARRVGRK